MEEAVRKEATITIGYTRKQAEKEWFDEECEKVNEEKITDSKYRQIRSKERNLFRKKLRQLDEDALIEIEQHRSIQNSRKFYMQLNDVKQPFEGGHLSSQER
jgi:ribosomal protein L20A (L18A)